MNILQHLRVWEVDLYITKVSTTLSTSYQVRPCVPFTLSTSTFAECHTSFIFSPSLIEEPLQDVEEDYEEEDYDSLEEDYNSLEEDNDSFEEDYYLPEDDPDVKDIRWF